LIDDDVIEPTNLSRLAGAVSLDVGRPKADVFSDLARRIRPDTIVRTVAERFPSEAGVRELRNADVVVSCLDSLTARVELQKFSWRYLIPLVDIGIGTRLKTEDGPRRAEAIAGHVHVYLPGGPCMWCTGLLSKEKLVAETGGRGPDYVEGAVNPAQVVSFNGVVASMAITEAMQLVTGFIARKESEFFRTYDAVAGELYSLRPRFDEECPHGVNEIGLGSPAGYSPTVQSSRVGT
jgi:molybdopterin/thiamine biosynthesis adenylyltransferase